MCGLIIGATVAGVVYWIQNRNHFSWWGFAGAVIDGGIIGLIGGAAGKRLKVRDKLVSFLKKALKKVRSWLKKIPFFGGKIAKQVDKGTKVFEKIAWRIYWCLTYAKRGQC